MSQESFLDHFRQAFADFYQRVIDLGFTMANACYPMSSGATENAAFGQEGAASVYGAVSSDPMVTFSKQEKALLFRALFETIPKFRNRLRIFSPRCSLHGLIGKFEHDATPLFPCRGGLDFFFAECEQGLIHPCGYRQESSYLLPDLSRRLRDPECCNSCEWECFRDPSDLLGPFAELFTRPFSLVAKMRRDRQFFRLLAEDLRYYQACRYFDCRLAPDQAALKRFRIDHQVD